MAKATPVCLRCLTPVNPLQNYCHNCGETVGQLAPYIPFVNIPYNYSIFGIMWKKIWNDKQTSLLKKGFYFLLIVLFVPIMLVGIPFVLGERFRRKPQDQQPKS